MSGNGSSMAGILVEGGTFDWMQNDKFPSMTEPYEGYHGLSFAEEFGPTAFTMMARAEGMRDMGPCLAPQNAWNILHGLETLSLRMEKHCSNALKWWSIYQIMRVLLGFHMLAHQDIQTKN